MEEPALVVKGFQMKWESIHEPVRAMHRSVFSSDDEEDEEDFLEGSSGG
jgi:hypothetical protein